MSIPLLAARIRSGVVEISALVYVFGVDRRTFSMNRFPKKMRLGGGAAFLV